MLRSASPFVAATYANVRLTPQASRALPADFFRSRPGKGSFTFYEEFFLGRNDMAGVPLQEITVGIKGAGEMASGVAWRLWQGNIRRIFMLEVPRPLAVRRKVSFCEAIYDGEIAV